MDPHNTLYCLNGPKIPKTKRMLPENDIFQNGRTVQSRYIGGSLKRNRRVESGAAYIVGAEVFSHLK